MTEETARESPDPTAAHDPRTVSTKEVSEFLREIARFMQRSATGNPALIQSLNSLADWIKKHRAQTVDELINSEVQGSPKRARGAQKASTLALNVSEMSPAEIKATLGDPELTKGDLVQIAHRFGIPKSRLARESAPEMRAMIAAAVDNSVALDIIAKEAARLGSRRTH